MTTCNHHIVKGVRVRKQDENYIDLKSGTDLILTEYYCKLVSNKHRGERFPIVNLPIDILLAIPVENRPFHVRVYLYIVRQNVWVSRAHLMTTFNETYKQVRRATLKLVLFKAVEEGVQDGAYYFRANGGSS